MESYATKRASRIDSRGRLRFPLGTTLAGFDQSSLERRSSRRTTERPAKSFHSSFTFDCRRISYGYLSAVETSNEILGLSQVVTKLPARHGGERFVVLHEHPLYFHRDLRRHIRCHALTCGEDAIYCFDGIHRISFNLDP